MDRPNLLIEVPATLEGLEAIRRLIAQGINVNMTLLLGQPCYREVAEAYMAGIEEQLGVQPSDSGDPVERVASVASVFLSRIEVLVSADAQRSISVRAALRAMGRSMVGMLDPARPW